MAKQVTKMGGEAAWGPKGKVPFILDETFQFFRPSHEYRHSVELFERWLRHAQGNNTRQNPKVDVSVFVGSCSNCIRNGISDLQICTKGSDNSSFVYSSRISVI